MRFTLVSALLAATLAMPAAAQEIVVTARPAAAAFAAPAVADPVLARMRGGVRLLNGFDVAIGIDIQTRLNGLLVLHTVYASDGPMAGVRVYTDGVDGDRVAPGTVTVSSPGETGAPTVVVNRSPTGTTITPSLAGAPSTVNLVDADPGMWLNAIDQNEVAVTENGPPVMQGPGTFRLTSSDNGSVVTLAADMVEIRHLIGQATGVAIANTGNNRAIDTVSSVNVDLQGAMPIALAGLFTADRLAFDAMAGR